MGCSGTPPRPARSTQPGVFSCSSGPRRRRGVLEGHGVGPRPSRGELVPDVPEDLLGRTVADTVALPRHARPYSDWSTPPARPSPCFGSRRPRRRSHCLRAAWVRRRPRPSSPAAHRARSPCRRRSRRSRRRRPCTICSGGSRPRGVSRSRRPLRASSWARFCRRPSRPARRSGAWPPDCGRSRWRWSRGSPRTPRAQLSPGKHLRCACTHASSHAWGRTLSACPRIGPERLSTALAAEFASPLERLQRHDPERLHTSCQPMPPSYASGLLPVQEWQHPTTEQAVNVETKSRGVARNREHLSRQLEALPR